MSLRVILGRAAAAVMALLAAAISAPAFGQMRIIDERTLVAEDGTAFIATRGMVRVPELRAELNSSAVDLAFVRVRREGQNVGKVSAILAGGPGDSGVDEVLNLARRGGARWFRLMDGEVLGVDQRGTGASRPSLASNVLYNLPLDRPGSPDSWLPIIEQAARDEASRVRAKGVNLNAYNTEESADDFDAVRRALGYSKITLWGRSYGSHLALAILGRHPDAVEQLVLISPEGPDQTWKSPAQVDKVLARIAARANAPDLLNDIKKVLSELSKQPASVAITDPATGAKHVIVLGKFDVQLVVAQALGDPRGISGLPAAFRQMAAGDYRAIGRLVYSQRSRMGLRSSMKHAMDLASAASPARLARIHREAQTALLGNAINFPDMMLREAWQVNPLPAPFRAPVHSSIPVLMIVGDLDARTPIANAQEIAATLPNAKIVVAENAAHQFNLFGSPALQLLLHRFLTGQPITDERVVLPPLPFTP